MRDYRLSLLVVLVAVTIVILPAQSMAIPGAGPVPPDTMCLGMFQQ